MARRGSVSVVALVVVMAAMAVPGVARAQAPAQDQTAVSPATPQDLGATQQRLMQLLRVSPNLAEVVSSDPALLADQQYVSKSNPELATFLQQHPEIARNPEFWLFSNLRTPQQERYPILEQRRGLVPPRDGRNEGLSRAMRDIAPSEFRQRLS